MGADVGAPVGATVGAPVGELGPGAGNTGFGAAAAGVAVAVAMTSTTGMLAAMAAAPAAPRTPILRNTPQRSGVGRCGVKSITAASASSLSASSTWSMPSGVAVRARSATIASGSRVPSQSSKTAAAAVFSEARGRASPSKISCSPPTWPSRNDSRFLGFTAASVPVLIRQHPRQFLIAAQWQFRSLGRGSAGRGGMSAIARRAAGNGPRRARRTSPAPAPDATRDSDRH